MLLLYLIGRKYLKRDLSVYTIQINEKRRKWNCNPIFSNSYYWNDEFIADKIANENFSTVIL